MASGDERGLLPRPHPCSYNCTGVRVLGFLEPAQYELLARCMYVTNLSVYCDDYCADVIRPFLMSCKNLNITNGQSDVEQMLRTIATA